MTVRYASAVDDLSEGRLVLGLGAGWQEREHRAFGVPFHDFKTRFEMLEDALEMTRRLYDGGEPVSYQGTHFALDGARLVPKPRRKTPILVGGNGPRRTLPLAATYADEWNAVYCNIDTYRERMVRLDQLLATEQRATGEVKRSLMAGIRWVRNDSEIETLLAGAARRLQRQVSLDDLRHMGLFAGTSEMIVDQIGEFAEAGCERILLQILDYDDLEPVDRWAREILPHFH